MREFLEVFNQLNIYSVMLRLLLATISGGIIGLDRGSTRRAAGFRTYMLVCLGAAVTMMTGEYIYQFYSPVDPMRIGAQVVSGIGFLGAGTIIVTSQNQVVGLTTAAGLWASACIGLAIGSGFYSGAIAASFFLYIIITQMHRLDQYLYARSKTLEVYVELRRDEKAGDFLTALRNNGYGVDHVAFTKPQYVNNEQPAMILVLILPKWSLHTEVIESVSHMDEVAFIQEVA
jgi:putative Mg2+ transporter-C (MgtC) family protein